MTAGTDRAAVRIRVDFIACDGRGLCAQALPELITLDDWGFPIVDRHVVPGIWGPLTLFSGLARALLLALGILTALTGARTTVVWFKVCPVLVASAAALLLAASLV